MVKDVSEHTWYTEYEDEVLNHDKPVVIVFSATWCGSCERLLDRLNSESFGVEILHMDVDKCPSVSDDHGVTSLPLVVLYQRGEVVAQLSNNTNIDDIIDAIQEIST